jgi:integrase
MSRAPRGTTMTIRRDADPTRKAPWGVFWNEYKAGHVGRPKQRSAWFATEADAQTFRAATLAALASDVPVPLAPAVAHRVAGSFAALAPDWLSDVESDREDATHASYADTVKNWLAPAPDHARFPGIGTLLVGNTTMTTVAIKAYLKGLQRNGASLACRHRCQRAISAFCTWAKGAGYLTIDNPAFGLGRVLRHKDDVLGDDEEVHPFTLEQMAEIFDVIASSEEDYLPYFQFLHDVGPRPGEAAALKWTALDLGRRKAKIELSYAPKTRKDKRPKTHEVRTVDLTTRVVELLLWWRAEQRREAMRRGRPVPVYVFTTRRLARILQDGNIQLVTRRVLDAAKVEGHRLYDFRHTFATSHLSVDWVRKLEWVSRQLGHKTPATTIDHYYAYRPSDATAGFADEIRSRG